MKLDLYQDFCDGLNTYLNLYEKGLKKQANQLIKNFIKTLETNLDQKSLNLILERFCYELCDKKQHDQLKSRGNGSLPYELNRLIWQYLKANCEINQMPHMRWIYQLYGRYYNPFDPQYENNLYLILQQAYAHPACDQQTVDLYFHAQLDILDWGAHHFPDCCLITEQTYAEVVQQANQIMQDHCVSQRLLEEFDLYLKEYDCYRKFLRMGKQGDFMQMCRQAGIP